MDLSLFMRNELDRQIDFPDVGGELELDLHPGTPVIDGDDLSHEILHRPLDDPDRFPLLIDDLRWLDDSLISQNPIDIRTIPPLEQNGSIEILQKPIGAIERFDVKSIGIQLVFTGKQQVSGK